ncbi:MAG: hypothetical protein JOZ90_16235 [Alphaproteobacteria bacterium]|nr:hypothetical protein [Alphaproteobacteria bacterium]MBV9371994.1 hypothetical protein [Alphaproteobacteria bacterium]MBV9902621.1 hypothetical protein [Alphaproteobacteria bacterium]
MPDPLSGIVFACCALAIAATFALAASDRVWPRFAPVLICAAAASSALLFAATLYASPVRLGDLRFALRSVALGNQGERPRSVTAGGDPARDSLVIGARDVNAPPLAGAALRIDLPAPQRPDGPGYHPDCGDVKVRSARFALCFTPPASSAPPMVAVLEGPSGRVMLGSRRFEPGMSFCVGTTAVALSEDGKRLAVDGRPVAQTLPSRRGRIMPIRYFAAAGAAAVDDGPLAASRSFLYRDAAGLRIALLDPEARVVRGARCAGAPSLPLNRAAILGEGGETLISFQAVAVAEPWEVRVALDELASGRAAEKRSILQRAWGGVRDFRDRLRGASAEADDLPSSRLVERRTARLSPRRSADAVRLVVDYDTPEIQRVSIADVETGGGPAGVTLSFGGLGREAWGTMLAELRFRSIGAPVSGQFHQRLQLAPGGAELTASGKRLPYRFGDSFSVGGEDGASIQLDRLDFDWRPLKGVLLLTFSALLFGVAGTWRMRVASPTAFTILALGEFLLVVRLLVAIEAAIIDPRPAVFDGVPASLLALASIPFILSGLAPRTIRASQPRSHVLWHAALVAAVFLFVCLANGPDLQAPLILGPLALAALLLRLRTPRPEPAAAEPGEAEPAAERPSGRWRAVLVGSAQGPQPALAGLAIASIVLSLARLPFDERISLSQLGNPAVAILFTPLYILFAGYAAWLAARALGSGRDRLLRWVLWWPLLALPLLVTAFRGDNGFAVVNAVPVGLFVGLVALWRTSWSEWRRGALRVVLLAAPLAMVCALIVNYAILAAPQAVTDWPAPGDMSEAAQQTRRKHVEAALETERSTHRRWAFTAPHRLAGAGTREAEELRATLEYMREYADQPPFGRGYLNQPEPVELRRYHLADNLAAVHLLAPFGRLGTAALLLVLGAAAAACSWRLVRRSGAGPPSWPAVTGLFALWTLFGVSAYMVMSNLALLPFTGRNVVLLAANSPSDLVEGLLILLIALCGLHWGREART